MDCITSIAANIGLNCEAPLEGGYTGRGILIPYEAKPILTKNASNPRIIEAIAIAEDAHVCSVDNSGATPFDGSQTTGNQDAGYAKFTKAMTVRVIARGGQTSLEVVEPLVKSSRGFIGIFEKVDRCGDGSFEVVGSLNPLKCVDPATATRSETANGGAWSVTLQTSETFAELTLFKTDYETTLGLFEALLEKAF